MLTVAERSGDFSSLPAQNAPRDPQTNMPFVNGIVPAGLFDPLVTKYLDTFVPAPNEGEDLYRSERDLDGDGEMLLGRLDWRRSNWSLNFSYFNFRNRVDEPFRDVGVTAPGLASRRTQRSHNAQITLAYAPGPSFSNSVRLAGQRLSSKRRQGRPDFIDTPRDSFGFDFQTYGAAPSTLPDIALLAANGTERLRIAPFLFASHRLRRRSRFATTWRTGTGDSSFGAARCFAAVSGLSQTQRMRPAALLFLPRRFAVRATASRTCCSAFPPPIV